MPAEPNRDAAFSEHIHWTKLEQQAHRAKLRESLDRDAPLNPHDLLRCMLARPAEGVLAQAQLRAAVL